MRKKSKGGRKKSTGRGRELLNIQQQKDNTAINSDSDSIGGLSDEDFGMLAEYGDFVSFLRDLKPETLASQKESERAAERAPKTKFVTGPNAEAKEERRSYSDSDDGGEEGDQDDGDENEEADLTSKLEHSKARTWDVEAPKEPTRLPTIKDGKVVIPPSAPKPVLPADTLRLAKEKAASRESREQLKKEKEAKTAAKVPEKVRGEIPADDLDVPEEREMVKLSKADRQALRIEAQERMAELAAEVLGDPEEMLTNLKRLKHLTASTHDPFIQKIGLLSQVAVYRDIIPGYRIRTNYEADTSVSKDVQKLRLHEQRLLGYYQTYLQQLDTYFRHHVGKKSRLKCPVDPTVAIVAMQCMGELLTTVPHFNFRVNLLTAVVSGMGMSRSTVSNLACNAVSRLFENDPSGQYSAEGMKLIARMVKAKDLKVPAGVIKTFLHLRLRDEMTANDLASKRKRASPDEKPVKGKRKKPEKEPFVPKKRQKLEKVDRELEKEMKEAEAQFTREERLRWHSETLKYVFATYFRILKQGDETPLLPSALEGLAHFAHLIDVDFFNDLLGVLRTICVNHQERYDSNDDIKPNGEQKFGSSTTRSILHCIFAAVQLLSGQGEVLNLDLKEFVGSLYGVLMRLPLRGEDVSEAAVVVDDAKDGRVGVDDVRGGANTKRAADVQTRSEIELVLMGLDALFCRKKQVQITKAASFVKRLASISLHLRANATLACLSLIRAMVIKHPRLQQLLDPEERLGSGSYKPYLEDPELCNPFATNLWELSLLTKHYHPSVRSLAKHVARTLTTTSTGASTGSHTLPPDLNHQPSHFLRHFDPMPNYPHRRFNLVPAAAMPAAIIAGVKARDKRLQQDGKQVAVKGPAVLDTTAFLSEAMEAVERDAREGKRPVEIVGEEGEVEEDEVVVRLKARERRLRRLVEISKELQIDLMDEDADDEEEEEDEEEDDEVNELDGEEED
ncbi:CBF/Mak21 family-domain-containing protein [Zopfochytrium polystomum]|nr:CBF/Mak21 family-domain-containing protein [Zopfochytrium polystomum]